MSGLTVVVGAGLSGLSAGLALARRGDDVRVVEASDRPGGVVRSDRPDGFLLELGPNTVRPTPEVMGLVRELGLEGEALFADPRLPRLVDFGGALHAVPMSPPGLFSTGLLSAAGKLRMLLEPFVRRGGAPDESVRDFVTRRLGAEVAERLVEPFVGGVFAGSAARLSVADAFPALAAWEREHGSLAAGALAARRARKAAPAAPVPRGLLSFREGLETLPRALAVRLGDAYRSGASVGALQPRNGGWRLSVSGAGGDLQAGRVLLAVPAGAAAALVRDFAPEAASALEAIPHPPVAILHLAWESRAIRRPLAGFGHLVAPTPGRRILGAVWSSSLFPNRAPAGRQLMTVFLGGSRDPEAFALSDAELVAAASRDLQAEGLVGGPPDTLRVTRWPRAIPQYERGHAGRIAALADAERRWPGLRFLGSYRGGISVGDVVREGLAAGAAP
jgi:protoporphyrinogen/coproporphyrinogen III oxidase